MSWSTLSDNESRLITARGTCQLLYNKQLQHVGVSLRLLFIGLIDGLPHLPITKPAGSCLQVKRAVHCVLKFIIIITFC